MDHNSGWLEVICGSMFSGKTEEMIRRLRRAVIAKQKVQVFKPKIDNRYDEQKVISHAGLDFEAIPISSSQELLQYLKDDTTVVGIDETQFLDEGIIPLIDQMVERGIRIIATGLDLDFRGEPFGCMPTLMAKAEKVDKVQAICMVCGEPASRTQRLVDGKPAHYNDPVVIVGAAEMYEARCRKHHIVPRS
ncbi:MAG: thymidine kinase [Anaerolineaceae bacterium]|jgi:thymidine kinase|nr:MAG: thymidine kinase [Anaerolineaceae bacterium]